jgi:tetratricopeptide (TPR) repeat protein
MAIGIIWFAAHREPAVDLVAPTPTPTQTPTPTPTPTRTATRTPTHTPTRDAGVALVHGIIAFDNKDYVGAMSAYNQAINLDPKYSEAYRQRGNLYKIQGQIDKAKADSAKADEIDEAEKP